jgi:tetratricopeptide (TPR) repeat protein
LNRIGSPSGPPPIIVQIDRAMRANQMEEASRLAQRALDGGLSHPILYSLRAWSRRRSGQLEGALEDLRAAQRLNPRSVNVLVGLADVLSALGRFGLAIAAANDALAIDRSAAAAWYQKGHAHQMINELDRAQDAFREAVRADPRMADALASLANLAALQGRHGEARDFAARVLALKPGDAMASAMASLALARADLAERRFDAAEPRLLALAAGAPDAETRAIALGYVGDARDAQDRIQDAFDAYRESGSAWHALHAPRIVPSGRETAREQILRLTREIAALQGWRPAGELPKPAGDESAGLVFIVGFPRSGTTLLARILARQQGVAVLEEKPVFAGAVAEFLAPSDGFAKLAALSDSEIARCRDEVWRRIGESGVETRGKLVIDQNALNTAYLPVILRLFPKARIVFALRDPRDVVFSCFRRQFGANIFTLEFHSLESSAAFYAAAMDLAAACRKALGLETLDIRNEDLIADFDGQVQRLCTFVGVPFDAAMRDFGAGAQPSGTISALQVRRGLSGEGVGQWRRYRAQMSPVLPALAPLVARFGYEPE